MQMDKNELKQMVDGKDENDKKLNLKWTKTTFEDVKQKIPTLTLEQLQKWSIGPYALTLAEPYLAHAKELKIWQLKGQDIFKVKGMISRFATSDKKEAKKYTIVVKIPNSSEVEKILSYCTCKSGARTMGGCAHSCAILYYLSNHNDIEDPDQPNTAKKRVSASGVIDLKDYKQQKIIEGEISDNEAMEEDGQAEH